MPVQVKVFEPKRALLLNQLKAHRDIRMQALEFINQQLEPDQVINVTESGGYGRPCSVAVWYKK